MAGYALHFACGNRHARGPANPPYESLPDIRLALDLDLQPRIDEALDLDQRRGRQMLAEIGDAARVDLRALGDIGHEHLYLDDVLGSCAGRFQAFVDHLDGDVELRYHVRRDAAVPRLADRAGDP